MTNEHGGDERWTMRDDAAGDDAAGWEEPGGGGDDDPPPLPNLFKRAAMALFSPGELFAALAPQPAAIGIMLLSAVVSALAIALVPAEAFLAAIPPQMQDAGMDVNPLFVKVPAVLAAFAGGPIVPLIVTVITWVVFCLIRRDEATFKQQLSVNAHAFFIGSVGAVCTVPLVIRSLDMTSTFSFASVLPFLADGFLRDVLASLDLFSAWALVVASLGLSKLDPRRSWRNTAIVMAGLWIAFALVAASLASFATAAG